MDDIWAGVLRSFLKVSKNDGVFLVVFFFFSFFFWGGGDFQSFFLFLWEKYLKRLDPVAEEVSMTI